MDTIDLARRFNGMPVAARKALFSLLSTYANRGLYMFDDSTLSSLLGGKDSDDTSIKVKLLMDHRFLRKSRNKYKLDRQKADSLITMGVLDIDEGDPVLQPMTPANEEHEEEEPMDIDDIDIPEPDIIDEPEMLDLNLPLATEDYEFDEDPVEIMDNHVSVNPEKFDDEEMDVEVQPKDTIRRFNLVEIIDRSDAGHKIDPPMWMVADKHSNKIYAIAQDGLRFSDADNQVYIGLKQLEFLKLNPHYILGVFADDESGRDKARSHMSKFFDTTIDGRALRGYLPHRSGEIFWVLQSARDGTYSVLPKGIIPATTMDKRKVTGLTHDEAIAVFVASEKNSERNKTKRELDAGIEAEEPDHKFDGTAEEEVTSTLQGFDRVQMEDYAYDEDILNLIEGVRRETPASISGRFDKVRDKLKSLDRTTKNYGLEEYDNDIVHAQKLLDRAAKQKNTSLVSKILTKAEETTNKVIYDMLRKGIK